MRKWLNEEFYNEAFSSNDKSIIRLTDLENESNPKSNISGGNNTTDRVFILSYGEAVKYFNADINASQEILTIIILLVFRQDLQRSEDWKPKIQCLWIQVLEQHVHIGSEQ